MVVEKRKSSENENPEIQPYYALHISMEIVKGVMTVGTIMRTKLNKLMVKQHHQSEYLVIASEEDAVENEVVVEAV